MDIAQVVNILDELLFDKTGSHLDFIQKVEQLNLLSWVTLALDPTYIVYLTATSF
jgi:hypothetical protein